MSSSTRSGGVVDEGAAGAAELVVERDAGGEGEQSLADACSEAVQGAGAVAFEREQVFAGPEDAFDALADRGQVRPWTGLVFAVRSDDQRVAVAHLGGEVSAGVALVADHDQRPAALTALDEFQADVAFVAFGAGQRDRARGAVKGEQAVQPKAPEKAAVAAAVAVVGGVGERTAAHRLDAARTLHRGRVDDQQVVIEARAEFGELPDQRLDHLRQALAALPVTGPLRQPREQVPEPPGRHRQETLVGRDSHHRLRDQSATTSASVILRRAFSARSGRRSSAVQNTAISSRSRSASIVAPWGRRRDIGTADFDLPRYVSYSTTPAVESVI